MIKKLNNYLLNKKGMTLVEVLTAMTILTLVIFCFAPLMLSYMQTINIAGDKMERVYRDAGNLEVLLGKNSLDSNYTVSLDTVPIKLTSPDATVNVDGNSQNVSTATIESFVKAYGLTSGGTFAKDKDGNPIEDGNVNISTGQATFYTDKAGSASGITLFPSSLTDDFKVAYITIYSADINFVLSQCDFVTTGPTSEIKLTKGVDYDLEYHPDAKAGATNMLLLTVYGGGDKISFETSPLVFKHLGQRYEIQIDAPMMIMVGEKSLKADDEGNQYHYYVSRGEIDEDGYLLIHRRAMETTNDPNGGGTVTLNSAMNDVEWVPAESADAYSKDSSGDSYGYYVMCGDNGQVRRFWKRPDTTILSDGKTVKVDGNYYWGGDYTYYTDIELDRVSGNNYYSLDGQNDRDGKTYSTSVSYKFLARRPQGSGGYVLASKDADLFGGGDNKLYSVNMWTVTALGNSAQPLYYYATDGKIYSYIPSDGLKSSSDPVPVSLLGTYDNFITNEIKNGNWNRLENIKYGVKNGDKTPKHNLEDYTWLTANANSYYDAINVEIPSEQKNSYPITLTSVDSIVLTGSGGGYYGSTADHNYETTDAGATYNSNLAKYPTQTYTLYAGYIPASMDIWTADADFSTSFNGALVDDDGVTEKKADGAQSNNVSSNIARKTNNFRDSAVEVNALWKANLGITPYLTSGTTLTTGPVQAAYTAYVKYSEWFTTYYKFTNIAYWPYTNLNYAVTGKFYDSTISATNSPFANPELMQWKSYSGRDGRQNYMTNGRVVDITMAYLSHPFAMHVAANPTDDVVYDQTNQKQENRVFYWNNRRETITFLDIASAMVPSGENDIPVSLAVGYVMGGMVEMAKNDLYVNTVMNNGIVYLRAGTAEFGKQSSSNSETGEYYAKDSTGYKLDAESNYFHQFYYLNSRTKSSDGNEPYRDPTGAITYHIGNMYGAEYWQNNRHINYISMYGGVPYKQNDTNTYYDYLRCHPMSNTKVTCVEWGTTWNGYPEAMWGTENGTVLSWWVNTGVMGSKHDSYNWNDRSVDAEIQSYKWIDNINGKNFNAHTTSWAGTVGSAIPNSNSTVGSVFKTDNVAYQTFFDKGTQATNSYSTLGFINTLENINDIEFADDLWVAAGDQSDKNPADYSASGEAGQNNPDLKANAYRKIIRAYSDYPSNTGKGGSWINVRYWVDLDNGKHSDTNSTYHWRAVQISKQSNYNIVQINHVNGMWVATGYIDGTNGGKLNDEYDEGEKTVICWTYDPLIPCGAEGGWSENVRMYDGNTLHDMNEMGGINSCATRD